MMGSGESAEWGRTGRSGPEAGFSSHRDQEAVSHMPEDSRDGKEPAIFKIPDPPLSFLIGLVNLFESC